MRIFWFDREGNRPPSNALFNWRPFFPNAPFPFNGKAAQIEKIPSPTPPIKVLRRVFSPHRAAWIEGVEQALGAIAQGELKKVVLARICSLELAEKPNPFAIAAALKQKAQGAFVFCLQSSNAAFIGASPECLFSRKGREISSEAMAGTRKRGKNPHDDEQLKQELLSSVKDFREFSPVQDYLRSALSPLCQSPLRFTPVAVHQTQNVQHLYSRCTGQLKGPVSDEEIVSRLHPTPALCGVPKEKASALIRKLEPFERGLYGGTIGWSTPDASEWIVGIRSCLLQGNTAILFSGTGIVEGSDPAAEWEELDQKLKLYEGIFV